MRFAQGKIICYLKVNILKKFKKGGMLFRDMASYNLLRLYNALGIDPDKVPRLLGGGDLSKLSNEQKHSLLARLLYDEAGHTRGAPLNLPGMALATAALGTFFSPPAIVQAQQQSDYKPAASYEQSDPQNNANQTKANNQPEEKIPVTISVSADNLEQGKLRANVGVETLVPVYRGLFNGDNLVGLQATGNYGRFTDGKTTLEGAVGIVIGNRYNKNSASRIGVFYQDRRDTGKLNFGVASVAAAYQIGDGEFQFYGGFPITKRQLSGLEELTKITSATSELNEGGFTTTSTTTTQVDTRISSWEQARKVFTFSGTKDLTRDLRLKLGGAYYGGIAGGLRQYDNVTENTENVPPELRGILGLLYSPEFLSRLFRGDTQLSFEMRAGQGGPQYLGQLSINFNQEHKHNSPQEARLLAPLRLEKILVAAYKSKQETTTVTKSPSVSLSSCPTNIGEGETYSCIINLSDGTLQLLDGPSFLKLTAPAGTSTALSSPAINYALSGFLDFDSAGEYPVRLQSTNSSGSTLVEYLLTINNTNRPPVLEKKDLVSIKEGDRLELIVAATDQDKEDTGNLKITASYNGGNLPSWITTESLTDAIKLIFSPVFPNSGSYKILIRADDGHPNGTDQEEIDVNVAHVNRAPSFDKIGDKSSSEGNSLEFTINNIFDPDGDKIAIRASGLPAGSSYSDSSRKFSWLNIEYDKSGTYKITFTADDGNRGTYSETMTITVNDANRPPSFAKIGSKSGFEGSSITFTIDNVTDPDGDLVRITASGLPRGAAYDDARRQFSWNNLGFDQSGTYSISFTADDGKGGIYKESVELSVGNTNLPPIFDKIGDKSSRENETLEFKILNISDPDGDSVQITASNLPTGAIYSDPSRTFSWRPEFTQSGTYSGIKFTADDGKGGAYNETISITIGDVNRAPVFNFTTTQSGLEGTLLQFTTPATDADGDSLTYSASNLPSGASYNASTQTFSWTPSSTQSGTYTPTISVSDGKTTTTQTATINISDVNRAPVFNFTTTQSGLEGTLLQFTTPATDADGDSLTYSASGLPSGSTFNSSTRTFSWTPSFTQSGSYSPVFSVTDGTATTNLTSTINITDVNRAPSVAMDSPAGNVTITAGQSVNLQSTRNDPDLDSLVSSWTAAATAGGPAPSISGVEDPGNVTFTNAGVYSLTTTVNDGKPGGLATSTARTITVLPGGGPGS